MKRKDKYNPRNATSSLTELLPDWLQARGLTPQAAHLVQLWRNWAMVMGKHLAPLALPLGNRGKTLLIGAEDNYILQDLSLCSEEILERANAFMDGPFFDRVEFRLCLGKTPLNQINLPGPEQPRSPSLPVRPDQARHQLDLNSPLGRCYLAYIGLFDRNSS